MCLFETNYLIWYGVGNFSSRLAVVAVVVGDEGGHEGGHDVVLV